MTTEMYEQTESGVWLPKPKGIQVTCIWVKYIGQIKVLETLDEVDSQLMEHAGTSVFHDLFNEPVYVYDKAEIVALSVAWEDGEAIELDLKERELTKKMRSQQLSQTALQMATPVGNKQRKFH